MSEREPKFEEENPLEKKESQNKNTEKQELPFGDTELREVSPEFIKTVEQSKLFEDSKVNLLLTARGLKPASEITMPKGTRTEGGDYTPMMSEEEVKDIISVFEKSGIPFDVGTQINLEPTIYNEAGELQPKRYGSVEYLQVLVGKTPKHLDALKKAFESEKNVEELLKSEDISEATKKEINSKRKEELGFALGFPATAVEAYARKGEYITREDLPPEVRDSEEVFFSLHAFSKDNWQEEIKQGKKYAGYIKSISPDIYKEYVDEKREPKPEWLKEL